jgi:hypothetical protein
MKIVQIISGGLLLMMLSCTDTSKPVLSNAYPEYPNPKHNSDSSWKTATKGIRFSFASSDIRYQKEKLPGVNSEAWEGTGWKGEKVHTQLLVWSTMPVQQLSFEKSALKNEQGNEISAENIAVSFIRYVMTDSIGRHGTGCGIEPDLDSSLAADVIDTVKSLALVANTTQPIWLSIAIPQNTPAGKYKGTIKMVANEGDPASLNYEINVLNRVLPAPKDWKFHLDLWQNPFAVSRMHGIQEWSDEHMKLMAPYMKMLAAAGQKVITATIIHDPWNSQTYDVYKSMVKWVKKKDGSWKFDYSVFDKWVEFMMSLGIDKEINCYSMIPWNLKFYYYDEAIGKDTLIIAKPGTKEYELHWSAMLLDFARHLKTKNWFDKTTIAMDERPMDHMQIALRIIRKADKDFKVSMAGDYHKEIEKELFDYSVASQFILAPEVMERRKKDGFITSFYTACPEEFPNTFSFSPPVEAAYLGWYAAAKGFDGYLRWAYNSWPEKPLQDSRFGKWSAGDTYFVYPGFRSSIRFERLLEGIQAFEKTKILMDELRKNGDSVKLKRIENVLKKIEINQVKKDQAASIVKEATSVINSF